MSEPTAVDVQVLKAVSRGDLLNPKLPLLKAETGKRQDDRDFSQVRPIFVQTGVREESRGSSYVEYGRTKVICVVQGPKDLSKKIDFTPTGIVSVVVQSVSGKVTDRMITLMKDALEAVIILEKFPKAMVEVHLTILEDCGSALSACVTAAGLALADAGIPLFDIMIGSSVLFDGKNYYIDPTLKEIEALDLTDDVCNEKGGGIVCLGCMPSRDQICLFTMEGKMPPEVVVSASQVLTKTCYKIFTLTRNHLAEKLDMSSIQDENAMQEDQ